MENSAIIEAQQVSKVFAGEFEVRALDNVSVSIRRNEFFTLLGPSGCGKTTLLRSIAGFEAPTSGRILLSGKDITALPPNKRPVNTVFQSYALFPHMTVAQNIGFGLEMLGKPKPEISAKVDEMLKLVQMEHLKNRRTSELSGGQQQRVALARALAPHPDVLLLDEPLSALDFKLRKEMQIELKRLQHETGITFIFVTHDQEEALTMSDRIAVMKDGNILQIGTPHTIYNTPVNRFVADFIGDTNFLDGKIEAEGVRLSSGDVISVSTSAPHGSDVTLAVRPEHLMLDPGSGSGSLRATIVETVYFGTDTHFHLSLADGSRLVARVQNPTSGVSDLTAGSSIGLSFHEGAVKVLED